MSLFEVGIVGTFVARHHLVGDFGPSRQDHGHAYRVDVRVTGERLGPDGTLFDITRLQGALDAVTTDLTDQDLNGIRELASPNPTAEVVARYFFLQIKERLLQPASGADERSLAHLSVRVWESSEAFASYTDELT